MADPAKSVVSVVVMPHEMRIRVRPYQSSDREAVREICWQTAFMGQRLDFMYRDRESWVDLFTRYFTDREPESSFVACDGSGRVVGYLFGALDSRRQGLVNLMTLLRHVALRFLWARPGTARFWWRMVLDHLRLGKTEPEYDRKRFASEMHINLLPEARRSGAARDLTLAWFTHARRYGVAGVYGHVLADNERSLRFLEKLGFVRAGAPHALPAMRGPRGERLYGQQVLCDLASAPLEGSPDVEMPRRELQSAARLLDAG